MALDTATKMAIVGRVLGSKVSELENEATVKTWIQTITKAKLKLLVKSALEEEATTLLERAAELQDLADEINLL